MSKTWTAEKNRRRFELIDKEVDETISGAEKKELADLQAQMLAHREKVAPLPIKELETFRDGLDDTVEEAQPGLGPLHHR